MTGSDRILDGVRVLDLTTFVTGGFCSLMLANQGAEVIKVERPEVGDDNRHSGPPFVDGESPYFWSVNYGKKSVELDLKSDAGREALYELASEADVFIQNYRPGTAERLDVDEDAIRAHNDDVIYCAISAFGQTGPWRERPGYDLLIQGMSGIMSVTGEADGKPVKVGLPMTDLITAMWAAFGISNALYRRQRTGEGEYIDLGMLDAALPWLTKQAGKVFAGESPSRMGTKDPVLAPYQTFETADGHINVACLNQKLWKGLCTALERPDLVEDERFETNADRVEHMGELEAELEATFRELTTDEWMVLLVEEAGIPAGPVFEPEDALYNEQTDARDTVTSIEDPDRGEIPVVEHPLKYDRSSSGFESPPPQLGEHNRSVFATLGYDEDELDELEARGAFGGE
ncbi:CaiB/BaiF CoA transferase family protein [Halostagnicola kamekurae]|uniref:Crotonobetainyl-CoA:carnitine CoA-transferase CaiB n=1 Tax=Halostagnicola kamekurae TaxID=619731 RepID=A0A1I6TPY7_9EURY|nr:CoA transferase [Halostagnicola kamekurae]SFS91240.1 Crotonobetainyl-CoA:carnitine CoA-transferase CaiB [Halostagnicola kamekurae]